MNSFFEGRSSFVQLQGYKSQVLTQEPSSVLQGTKNAGTFYNIFNLKVVYLSKVMRNPKLYHWDHPFKD